MPRIGPTLFDLASEHDGVFTAVEAAAAGVSAQALVMAERRGTLRRLSRGMYRLEQYPTDEHRAQLWEAVLWPKTQRRASTEPSTLSHLTALSLHDPDLMYRPSRVTISVPTTVRLRRAAIPAWLDVHHADLAEDDVTTIEGLPATTFTRSIRDCSAIGTDRRIIEQTIATALRSRAIGNAEARKLRAEIR
jgi:predicted transcriptional regulator of viral defense system